jgi:hypothetical protein
VVWTFGIMPCRILIFPTFRQTLQLLSVGLVSVGGAGSHYIAQALGSVLGRAIADPEHVRLYALMRNIIKGTTSSEKVH